MGFCICQSEEALRAKFKVDKEIDDMALIGNWLYFRELIQTEPGFGESLKINLYRMKVDGSQLTKIA